MSGSRRGRRQRWKIETGAAERKRDRDGREKDGKRDRSGREMGRETGVRETGEKEKE